MDEHEVCRQEIVERDARIADLEAELSEWKGKMSCGHPRGCIVGGDEGTNYCSMCALEAENARLREASEAALPIVQQRVRLNQSSASVRALHLLTAALRGESEATE